MDPVAREIWEASKPHAPAAFLAYLARENLPFPVTNQAAEAPGLNEIIASGFTVERYGYEYFRFRCPECRTAVFEPATQLGMAHVQNFARRHDCDGRSALNRETIWPDSLGG